MSKERDLRGASSITDDLDAATLARVDGVIDSITRIFRDMEKDVSNDDIEQIDRLVNKSKSSEEIMADISYIKIRNHFLQLAARSEEMMTSLLRETLKKEPHGLNVEEFMEKIEQGNTQMLVQGAVDTALINNMILLATRNFIRVGNRVSKEVMDTIWSIAEARLMEEIPSQQDTTPDQAEGEEDNEPDMRRAAVQAIHRRLRATFRNWERGFSAKAIRQPSGK
jgi:hypothetical protein